MHDNRIEIDEIDKMLEDLNHKLSEESKLKIELDEYIFNEIDKQHQKLNESMQSKLFEIQSLLSKHKQHLWNHIQAIKQIRSAFISHQEVLSTTKTDLHQAITTKGKALSKLIEALRSETKSSLNSMKNVVTSDMQKCCADLSQRDGEIDKKVSDLTGQMGSLADKQDLEKLYNRIVQEYESKIKLLVSIETLNKKTEEQANTLKNSLAKLATKESQEKLGEKMKAEWKTKLAEYAHKNDVANLTKQINETVSKYGRIKKTSFVLAAFMLSQWIVILLMLAGVIN